MVDGRIDLVEFEARYTSEGGLRLSEPLRWLLGRSGYSLLISLIEGGPDGAGDRVRERSTRALAKVLRRSVLVLGREPVLLL